MPRISRSLTAMSGLLLATALTACAAQPQQHYEPYPQQGGYQSYPQQQGGYQSYPQQQGPRAEYGRISNIQTVQVPQSSGNTSGGGAVLGGVVGGLLGNQIGGGSGRTAATVLGAVGGAVAGNAIEGRMNHGTTQSYRITVQLDQGGSRAYDVSSPGDLRTGDRVRLVGGQISRY
ncbi:glycine zipper 2TM domain-containing protein [Acidovorax sp. HDW3]|uniref:glycine zipper 2TM domain-containing protein n=1 Tax=Acidovorax sp. HDW3 TaxID=2714923 RepID=UPI001407B05E|nr:glycine zipper 2TM domain-containing protein [Acidovorax sp. HDW3]QIL44421.1 glycine zipper 2TM domain-containing protein [Acidovorax sp. HDW3]